MGQPSLRELIIKSQENDEEALLAIIERFYPLVVKYSKMLDYDDASQDLIVWIIKAIKDYGKTTKDI